MLAIAVIYVILLNLHINPLDCEKILAIFPHPGQSQYAVAEPYLKALAARGHQLTVISHFPQRMKLENFTDITLTSPDYESLIKDSLDVEQRYEMNWYFDFVENITYNTLRNINVKKLFLTTPRYDLVIAETMLTEVLYGVAPLVKAHLIGIATFGTDQHIDNLVGNISPFSYIPVPSTRIMQPMNFWDRLTNVKTAIYEWYFVNKWHLEQQMWIFSTFFPKVNHDLDAVRRNFSLVLVNQHFTVSFPRPYVPNMVEVAGMHINSTVTPLIKSVEDFINETEQDVIYLNMGAVAKDLLLPSEKVNIFLNVFNSLNVRVIWQFHNIELPNKPPNVLIRKRLPHFSILAHPRLKLIVGQGDVVSTTEAIYYAKPVVGIPYFFDQSLNMARVENMGFGLTIDYKNLTEEALKSAILEILQSKKYTDTVQVLSERFHDQPIKPLDKAIYWTEYVLRHTGAKFMRSTSSDLNFMEYYNLDILFFFTGCFSLLIGLIIWRVCKTLNAICEHFEPVIHNIRVNMINNDRNRYPRNNF